MDIIDEASISRATSEVESMLNSGLNYLINNAGIAKAVNDDTPSTLDPKNLGATITANVVGPTFVTWAFMPLIERGKLQVIANISSSLASIGIDHGGQHSSYSISKAALNILTYKQAKERPDLIPFLVDPGWVKTDMDGSYAQRLSLTRVQLE
ncbi:hypothetical protein L210DRAFT_2311095 [Boletus edulis BED1]|uniref:Uncharacterized protein n=1 Tax=Boletus edulis BED1 TaxID=1328754 RepID=A0AAD4BRC1_BOLED|nr:hypothetical protein L210DRAFT_2311095 [Boletus edulis BED1]